MILLFLKYYDMASACVALMAQAPKPTAGEPSPITVAWEGKVMHHCNTTSNSSFRWLPASVTQVTAELIQSPEQLIPSFVLLSLSWSSLTTFIWSFHVVTLSEISLLWRRAARPTKGHLGQDPAEVKMEPGPTTPEPCVPATKVLVS